MAAPTWENHEAETGQNMTSETVSVPAGTVDDDFLVGAGSWHSTGGGGPTIGTLVPPSGFTEVDSDNDGSGTAYDLRHRIASSEPADYVWSWDEEEDVIAALARISGVDPASPVNVVSSVNSGSSDTPTCPDVTTTIDDCLILRIVMASNVNWDGTDPYPASHTGRFALFSGSGGSGESGLAMATAVQASAGAVGTADFKLSASTQWHAFTIAIAPPVVAPDAPTETTGEDGEQPSSRNEVLSGPDAEDGEWHLSSVGADEWYRTGPGGVDPEFTPGEPFPHIEIDGSFSNEGTLGSLNEFEYAVGDNDALGFDTLYIRLSDDPDTSGVEILHMVAVEYVLAPGLDDGTYDEVRLEYQKFESGLWDASIQETFTGSSHKFEVTNLPADFGIDYRVVQVDTAGSTESDPSEKTTIRTAPEPPSQLSSDINEDGHAVLTWVSNSGSSYPFEVYDESGGRGKLVTTDNDAETWTDPNPVHPQTYSLQTYNPEHDKRSAALLIEAGLAPAVISVGTVSDNAVSINVTERDTSADEHELHRSTTSGFTPGAGTLIADELSPTVEAIGDNSVSSSTTYYYKLVSKKAGYSDAISNEVEATTLAAPVVVEPDTVNLTVTTHTVTITTNTDVQANTAALTVATFLTSISGTIPTNTVELTLTTHRASVNDYIDEEAFQFYWYSEYGLSPIVGGDPVATRGSSAWAKDQRGVWREYVQNTPRFTWTKVDNKDIVTRLFEESRTNKTQRNIDYGTNGTSGWSLSAGTLSVVNDKKELQAAGLQKIASDLQVLKVDASGEGSAVVLTSTGQVGTLQKRVFSVFARGDGQIMLKASSGSDTSFNNLSDQYERFEQSLSPAASTDTLAIKLSAGATAYILLAQNEAGFRVPAVSSPIRNATEGDVTRASDTLYYERVPSPFPPLAIYTSFLIPATMDDYTSVSYIWYVGSTTILEAPYLRHWISSGSFSFESKFASGGSVRTVTIDIEGLTSAGDFVETLCWYDGDGLLHIAAMKNKNTVLGQEDASNVAESPEDPWADDRIFINSNGGFGGTHIMNDNALKIVTRTNLNQEHINNSDWASLIKQIRNAVLGPGGNLKGGVSR